MKTIIVALAAGIALSGCTDEERAEQRTIIKGKLPAGCTVQDVGEYGQFDHVLVVVCNGQRTTSAMLSQQYSCGKTYCRRNMITASVG